MASYDYRCERDGVFELTLPLGTAPAKNRPRLSRLPLAETASSLSSLSWVPEPATRMSGV